MIQTDGSSLPAFGFRCSTCGGWHTDLPAFGVPAPVNLMAMPAAERAERCLVETDACVIDEAEFYARAILEIPIVGYDRCFTWMVWVSLSKASFHRFIETFEEPSRSHVGPLFAWLDSPLPFYPETRSLKTMIRLRDDFARPTVELEPTDYPLAIEQREGVSMDRAAELVAGLERLWPARG